MTQKNKELLLKDLCVRLPYGVKISDGEGGAVNITGVHRDTIIIPYAGINRAIRVDNCKPYLFPLSSMSEDQKYEFYLKFFANDCDFDYFKFYLDNGRWHKLLTSLLAVEEIIDWFHKNHIDYRGLIPMGLANDATGLNIY